MDYEALKNAVAQGVKDAIVGASQEFTDKCRITDEDPERATEQYDDALYDFLNDVLPKAVFEGIAKGVAAVGDAMLEEVLWQSVENGDIGDDSTDAILREWQGFKDLSFGGILSTFYKKG